MRLRVQIALFGIVGGVGLGWTPALAGTFNCDFNSDPSNILTIIGDGEWRPAEGATGQQWDGYLAVTDALTSQATKILFADFDQGMPVNAFTFSCDLRIGNPNGCSGRPGDGLSISFCRADDPVLSDVYLNTAGAGWSGTANEPGVPEAPGASEEGTQTGIAVGFDAWESGSALWPVDLNGSLVDIEGISVRVGNKVVAQVAMPTRNGACEDITSLQTGPYDPNNPGSRDGLCWQPLRITLDENAKLTVTWKGNKVLDGYQIAWSPGPCRLVFGGRTGGCNENHDVDNVQITTVPRDTIDHHLIGLPVGFRGLTLVDAGAAVADTNTIQLKVDGVPVTPTEVIKSGPITTIGWWDLNAPLAVGSTHTVSLSIRDTQGNPVGGEATFVVPSYITLPPEYAVTHGDTYKFVFHNNGDGTMTLEWRFGTLQAAPSVLGPWFDMPACSPYTVIPAERMLFFRLKR